MKLGILELHLPLDMAGSRALNDTFKTLSPSLHFLDRLYYQINNSGEQDSVP